MKTWINYFRNLKLFKKICLVMTAMIIFICIFFLLSLQALLNSYEKTLFTTTAKGLNHAVSSMEAEMNEISTLSSYIASDAVIQQNLMELLDHPKGSRQALTKRDAYQALYSYYYSNPYITSICLILEDDTICMGGDITQTELDLKFLHQQALATEGRPFWVSSTTPNSSIACVRQIRQIPYLRLRKLGVLYISIDPSKMIHAALSNSGYDFQDSQFVLFTDGMRIYPNSDTLDQSCKELLSSTKSQSQLYWIRSINHRKSFITTGSVFYPNWKYLYFRDYNVLFNHIRTVKLITIVSSILCCILALWVTQHILHSIFRHLDCLVEKIQRFGQGGIPLSDTSPLYETRQDEIGQLHRSFDQMTHSVKILRDENYDKQLLLRDTNIKMLEQQINPHFLYNTLDTINWMAQSYGADDISIMVRSLGNLFRASIANQKELIPLKEELAFLNNYIQIQKVRFKDRLNFEIYIAEKSEDLLIPKLCIQPLVENALKYALECTDEPCTIQVKIEDCGTECKIQVANTGSVFEDNLLQKLKQHTLEPQGSGIGLMNINSRLKLIYGEYYGLDFCNEGEMAIVILTIPNDNHSHYTDKEK